MPGFVTFEAEVIVKAPLAFFWGEFFNMNGIYVHGIWIFFGHLSLVVVISVVLKGEEWVSLSFGNLIGFFSNMFEVERL